MPRVRILSPGFTTPNGRAFLFPIVYHRERIAARGLDVRIVRRPHRRDDLECDVLMVDSKYHKDRWRSQSDEVLSEFERFRWHANRILFFDTGDSSGVLQVPVLPYVDAYYKSQLLRDRERYLEPMYGQRPYTDHYHRLFGIEDPEPTWSQPVRGPADLMKLRVSWNSGLADYRWLGPAKMALYERVRVHSLLRFPRRFHAPSPGRPLDVSCRMGRSYPRRTVAHQRERIHAVLGDRMPTGKVSRRTYLEELRKALVAVSPFGWGEITLKDFEVMLNGALLVKPDMSHLETFPDLYAAGETMIAHRWDLSDLAEVLGAALDDRHVSAQLAMQGQELYRHYVASSSGYDAFVDRFNGIVCGSDDGAIS